MIENLTSLVVSTKRITTEVKTEDSVRIHPYRAGRVLAGVWASIWGGGGNGSKYGEVGEYIHCSACSGLPGFPRFDEPAIKKDLIPNEYWDLQPNEQVDVIALTTEGSKELQRICTNPGAHKGFLNYFWTAHRGGIYLQQAISEQERMGLKNYSLVSFDMNGSPISWSVLYEMPSDELLKNVTNSQDITLENVVLYYDTIGVNTDRMPNWFFRNVLKNIARLHQMKTVLPAIVESERRGVPLTFRTDHKAGAHVLDFANEYYDVVAEIGPSNSKEGRKYYVARGFKVSPDLLLQLRATPGGIALLNSLDIGDYSQVTQAEAELYLKKIGLEADRIKHGGNFISRVFKSVGFFLQYGTTGQFTKNILVEACRMSGDDEAIRQKAISSILSIKNVPQSRKVDAAIDGAVSASGALLFPGQALLFGTMLAKINPFLAAAYAVYEAIPMLGGISGITRAVFLSLRGTWYSLRYNEPLTPKLKIAISTMVDGGYAWSPLVALPRTAETVELTEFVKQKKKELRKKKKSNPENIMIN